MRTILTIVATFLLTTLFWFSVPTVRQIVTNRSDKTNEETQPMEQVGLVMMDEEPSVENNEMDELIAGYEKRIKDLESQLKKANSARPVSTSSSAPSASTPVATTSETKESISIVGTWVYADPQTAEGREYQLIFNAYGAFKYYNTKIGFTMRDDNYSIEGNTLKIGYYSGKFALSNVNGVDYLEISGIKDYAGKLKRKK